MDVNRLLLLFILHLYVDSVHEVNLYCVYRYISQFVKSRKSWSVIDTTLSNNLILIISDNHAHTD